MLLVNNISEGNPDFLSGTWLMHDGVANVLSRFCIESYILIMKSNFMVVKMTDVERYHWYIADQYNVLLVKTESPIWFRKFHTIKLNDFNLSSCHMFVLFWACCNDIYFFWEMVKVMLDKVVCIWVRKWWSSTFELPLKSNYFNQRNSYNVQHVVVVGYEVWAWQILGQCQAQCHKHNL